MNKNLSKIIALVLVVCMTACLFVGCKKSDSKKNAEEAESLTPLVVGYSPFNEKFSPFFSETAYDQDVWALTQISLLTSDRRGSIIMNGIEGETSHVVLERMDDTIASPLQHDEQEQSAHHGKACGYGAHHVAPQRSLYFVEKFKHTTNS